MEEKFYESRKCTRIDESISKLINCLKFYEDKHRKFLIKDCHDKKTATIFKNHKASFEFLDHYDLIQINSNNFILKYFKNNLDSIEKLDKEDLELNK